MGNTSSVNSFSIGVGMPRSGNVSEWLDSTLKDPKPISYTLIPISFLIDSRNFPNVKDIDFLRKDIERALMDYRWYLEKKQGANENILSSPQ